MIREDSPLARLPQGLDPLQRRWLLGFRYSLDIFGIASGRLGKSLEIATFGEGSLQELRTIYGVDPCALLLTDAWSVIDAAWRLRGFLTEPVPRPPGPPEEATSEQTINGAEFRAATSMLHKMRNGFQHLDDGARRASEVDQTILGLLRWTSVHPDKRTFVSCTLVPDGVQRQQEEYGIINPLGRDFRSRVDYVTLDAFGRVADISRIIRAVVEIVAQWERVLAPQFASHPVGPGAYLMRVTIQSVDEAEVVESPKAGG